MRLTRRDAVVALGALGIGSAAVGLTRESSGESTTLLAVAELVYPSQAEIDESFVETYVQGRANAQPEYESHLAEAVAELDRQARRDFGQSFDSLSADQRRAVLGNLGVNRVQSDPDGTLSQRIRYYVVNDLLYAFYSTPVGGELLGIETPPGHPGGRHAYSPELEDEQ